MKTVEETYQEIDSHLKSASVAQIGGFRPPKDKITSWFGGQGVGLNGESLPTYNGKDMFVLLQVKIDELPYIPIELKDTKFFIVFFNREEIPFDKPHNDGWVIREYTSLDNLVLLPKSNEPEVIKDFPIKWSIVNDDAPGWETAWELIDLKTINETKGADEKFFDEYNRYSETKIGGYPYEIQHNHKLDGYVFQIGSEEKPGWMWADSGVAYFNKNKAGQWEFDCQFY